VFLPEGIFLLSIWLGVLPWKVTYIMRGGSTGTSEDKQMQTKAAAPNTLMVTSTAHALALH
jgi:hypothetical protein